MTRITSLLALPLLFVACAQNELPSGPDCSGDQCDEQGEQTGEANFDVLLGAETPWVKCWVEVDPDENADDFFRRDEVICELTLTGQGVEQQYGLILLHTADDRYSEVRLTPDAPRAHVKSLNVAAYPATIKFSNYMYRTSETGVYNGMTTDYTSEEISIERGNTATVDEPYVVNQPWDYWPVEVQAVGIRSAVLKANYAMDISGSGLTANQGADSSLDVSFSNRRSIKENDTVMLHVPVSSVGAPTAVTGTGYFGGQEIEFTIDGPGRYVADAEGLHAVETEADQSN